MFDKDLHSREDCLEAICGMLDGHNSDHQVLHIVCSYIWFCLNHGILTDDDLCNLVHQYPQLLIF